MCLAHRVVEHVGDPVVEGLLLVFATGLIGKVGWK
jgi:hypothetical protein